MRTSLARPAAWSDGAVVFFAGADPNGPFDRANEDLPVADAFGLGGVLDGLEDLMNERIGDDGLDLHLRYEIDDVGRAAVDFLLAPRAAEAPHLGDGHAL